MEGLEGGLAAHYLISSLAVSPLTAGQLRPLRTAGAGGVTVCQCTADCPGYNTDREQRLQHSRHAGNEH